jgi:CheY-like chemotaxis protein
VNYPLPTNPNIVAVTASVLIEDRLACDAAGMDNYLSKPMNIRDLDRALRQAQPA